MKRIFQKLFLIMCSFSAAAHLNDKHLNKLRAHHIWTKYLNVYKDAFLYNLVVAGEADISTLTANEVTAKVLTVDELNLQASDGEIVTLEPNADTKSYDLILPDASGGLAQALGVINPQGQLEWISILTQAGNDLLESATSTDIPLTLVLRDSTGSFAASDITAEALVITPTGLQGCIIFTGSTGTALAKLCVNQQAMIIAPALSQALQTINDTVVRGVAAVDLQMSYANTSQVASGNYAIITGGQNNSAIAPYSAIAGGLSHSVTSTLSVIAGGLSNKVSGSNSFIGAGLDNAISGNYSAVVSGTSHVVTGTWSAIIAGLSNRISGSISIIGAGANNSMSMASNAILAGQINTSTVSTFNFIGAGQLNNMIGGGMSSILSGSGNAAANTGQFFDACMAGVSNISKTEQCFIGAGVSNLAQDLYTAVLAGMSNSSRIANDTIMAGIGNFTGGSAGTFIGGGIFNTAEGTNAILTGSSNSVVNSTGNGFIMAGQGGSAAFECFVGAGFGNLANNTSNIAVVAGENNDAKASGDIIISGQSNTLTAGGTSFMGAGYYNILDGSVNEAIITGSGNSTTGGTTTALILGGQSNSASNATYSCVAGGYFNACNSSYQGILTGSGITLSSNYCMSLGGRQNTASGVASCASGMEATASQGTFLWTDASTTTSAVIVTTANKFVVRAAGGSYIFTNSTATSGVNLASGGGSWNNLSDKATKRDITPIEPATILNKLTQLPVYEWNFKSQDPSILHIGPIAQDFHDLFDYREHALGITSSDALGIITAALQNIYKNSCKKVEILKERLSRLEQHVDILEKRRAS